MNFRNALLRDLGFLLIFLLSEYLFWQKITFEFQFWSFFIFSIFWFAIVENFLKNNKFFQLHPENYWGTFIIILTTGILINLVLAKYIGHTIITPIYVSILVTLMIGKRESILATLTFSVFFSILFNLNLKIFAIQMLIGLTTAYLSKDLIRRVQIFIPFLAGVTAHFALITLLEGKISLDFHYILGFDLIQMLIGMGILPYFEYITRVYSNFGLLELENLNHPLLKKLSLKTPGTYYHSLILGNIVEAAAESINANSILAKVGAFFHDIGKTWKPDFFTENVERKENPHDNLKPKISALILDYHVKYGQIMAQKYRLPILIEDMILQHHGTRIKKYFYHKYLDLLDSSELKELDLEEIKKMFRYPGPKPMFKEALLLMIADSVEAISRSMKFLSDKNLDKEIENLYSELFFDGQMDNVEITQEELKKAKEAMKKVVLAMHHTRISYPNKKEIDYKEILFKRDLLRQG